MSDTDVDEALADCYTTSITTIIREEEGEKLNNSAKKVDVNRPAARLETSFQRDIMPSRQTEEAVQSRLIQRIEKTILTKGSSATSFLSKLMTRDTVSCR